MTKEPHEATSGRGATEQSGRPRARRIVVAVNPEAAFGRRSEVGPAVAARLRDAGHEVEQVQQPNYELLRRETAETMARRAPDALVVVGGDGMVSLGVNLAAETDLVLGIVAVGTGNDNARSLGLPVDDADAATALLLDALGRAPRRIDLGRVRHGEKTTWFAGTLSAGFDAGVNERANHMAWPRGRQRYTLAVLRELMTFRALTYDLMVDGVAQRVEAMLVSVSNGRSIGGGMLITPQAELDDGLLDLFIVDRMPRLRLLRLFPTVFRGRHTGRPEVHIRRVSRVALRAEGAVAYADGERVGPLPVEVTVVPGALRVLA